MGKILSDRTPVLFLFHLFYVATWEFLVKIKNCYRLLILELSDRDKFFFRLIGFIFKIPPNKIFHLKKYLGGMILAFFKYY